MYFIKILKICNLIKIIIVINYINKIEVEKIVIMFLMRTKQLINKPRGSKKFGVLTGIVTTVAENMSELQRRDDFL